jgi:hypothetical protein
MLYDLHSRGVRWLQCEGEWTILDSLRRTIIFIKLIHKPSMIFCNAK